MVGMKAKKPKEKEKRKEKKRKEKTRHEELRNSEQAILELLTHGTHQKLNILKRYLNTSRKASPNREKKPPTTYRKAGEKEANNKFK